MHRSDCNPLLVMNNRHENHQGVFLRACETSLRDSDNIMVRFNEFAGDLNHEHNIFFRKYMKFCSLICMTSTGFVASGTLDR